MFRTLGFILSTLGSVPSNVFTVVLGTLNTFDGTDPKVDRLKPKVRNTIFFPVQRPERVPGAPQLAWQHLRHVLFASSDLYTCQGSNRALSWSHDAWALIALIALLSAILVLGLLWKYMGLCSVLVLLIRITRAPRAQVKIIFLQMLVMC